MVSVCLPSDALLQHLPSYLYVVYIIQNAGLDEAQAAIKITWRNINKLRYAHDITLMAESEEELAECKEELKASC